MKNSDDTNKTRVNILEFQLGDGWNVKPAGGSSGEAYIAWLGERKIFLKRNSSPFLAVLSAEGIVPKLLWTKRLENGDVITAQKWVNSRELRAKDMGEPQVAELLSKIHSSAELLDMFQRIGNKPRTPELIVKELESSYKNLVEKHPSMAEALSYMKEELPQITPAKMVVCHGDMNHNNWIVNGRGDLYLIDWDSASVRDPAYDVGLLLHEYIPEKEWTAWLDHYGLSLTETLKTKMNWYVVSHALEQAIEHQRKNDLLTASQWVTYLQTASFKTTAEKKREQ